MSDDLSIKLPKGAIEGVVSAHVQAAVAEALGRDPQRLIHRVVQMAMAAKKDSYSRETLFEAAVAGEIRSVAAEEFKVWLEEQKPAIRTAVRAQLGSKKLAQLISDKLVDSINVSVQLKVDGSYS